MRFNLNNGFMTRSFTPLPSDIISAEDWISFRTFVSCAIIDLQNFYNSLPSPSFNRMRSWNECYAFFQAKLPELTSAPLTLASPILEEAALRLAFYLASFGMYRGKSPYLQCSKDIFKQPLLEIFHLIRENADWLNNGIATNPQALLDISTQFRVTLQQKLIDVGFEDTKHPSPLLISKVLLGMFAAVPALDRFATEALKELKSECKNSDLSNLNSKFDKSSFDGWIVFRYDI